MTLWGGLRPLLGDGERDLEVNKGLKIKDVWSILTSETGGQVGEETLDV